MARVPRLQNPTDVEISPADRAATAYDARAREPLRAVARAATVQIQAQVSFKPIEAGEVWPAGVAEDYEGRLTFRVVDLVAKGYTIRRGDKVTKIGSQVTELYVTHTRWLGHYKDGPVFRQAFLGTRRPESAGPVE